MKKDDIIKLAHDVLLQGTELAHELSGRHPREGCPFDRCHACETLKIWDKILSTRVHFEFRAYLNKLQGKKK